MSTLKQGNYSRIARTTGISRTHISKVLRGKSGVSMTNAVRIAEAAGVTLDDLMRHIDRARQLRRALVEDRSRREKPDRSPSRPHDRVLLGHEG